MMIHNIKDDNFKKEVLENMGPVLVDFWAPWCMPCKVLGPIIEQVADKYDGKIKVCKVNVDDSPQTASDYQIMSIPTIIYFNNGKVENQATGVPSSEELESAIESLLSATVNK
ncbi:MAG: thioredoxin [Elusimicrobiales bacterium]|nr:thioredoxin [Elusimicrobiales bacterium]